MTNKEAHGILEKKQSKMTTYRQFYTEEAIEANGLAILALEKQIPKKPTEYDSVPHGRCPSCHNAVRMYCDDPKNKYCIWCGQAIDWSK